MRIFIIGIWTLLLANSCSQVNKEDYAKATKELCSCISNEQKKAQQTEVFSNDVMHYAICSFEVEEKYGVDIENSEFDRAMSIHCPDFLALHNKVKKEIIGSISYE